MHPSMAAREQLIVTEKEQMRRWSRAVRSQGKSIALVPTMGYLHRGHLSLVQEASRLSDVTVVSIYVNPGQFAPSEDLSTYPSDFQADMLKLNSIGGVDLVFAPKNLYNHGVTRSAHKTEKKSGADSGFVSCLEQISDAGGHETWVRVEKLEKGLCGKSRPVFFRGVATVVTKLFNIVEPDVAVFGKKDYQQWRIIQRLATDLDFAIEIVGCEIERDSDGLALSSRNVHLSPGEREKALSINRSLLAAKLEAQQGQVNCSVLMDSVSQAITQADGRIDYAEIVDQETLEPVEEIRSPVVFCIAAWFGKVRLIDNMEINTDLVISSDKKDLGE